MAATDLLFTRMDGRGASRLRRRNLPPPPEASAKGHFDIIFVDQNDGAKLDAALGRKPILVLLEAPSNPLMRIPSTGI